jgi:hypothetical protein
MHQKKGNVGRFSQSRLYTDDGNYAEQHASSPSAQQACGYMQYIVF